jgi:pyridoxal 5'-phosphate synthase pdxT subunit
LPRAAGEPRVGVLALQGDVREHLEALTACGADAIPVRLPEELQDVDALVLPGGESTTLSRLLRVFGLHELLQRRVREGLPCLATCAGLIVLSREVRGGRPDQLAFGLLDVSVRRNGYGRQVDSFEADIAVEPLGVAPFPGVFIRAPRIEVVGPAARVIASLDGIPVAIEQGPHLGLCFHPEMTDDLRIHELFIRKVERHLQVSAA